MVQFLKSLVIAAILAVLFGLLGCTSLPAGLDVGFSYQDGVHVLYWGLTTAPVSLVVGVAAATAPAAASAPAAPAAPAAATAPAALTPAGP